MDKPQNTPLDLKNKDQLKNEDYLKKEGDLKNEDQQNLNVFYFNVIVTEKLESSYLQGLH